MDYYKFFRTPTTSYLNSFEGSGSVGLYDPTNFVISVDGDGFEKSEPEKIATLLHETTHWWQTVGTTSGFITSSIYPVQGHLIKLVKNLIGKYPKPLLKSIPVKDNVISSKLVSESEDLTSLLAFMNNFYLLENTHAFIQDPRVHGAYKSLIKESLDSNPITKKSTFTDEWEEGLLLSQMIAFEELDKTFYSDKKFLSKGYAEIHTESRKGSGYRDVFSKSDIGYYHICEGQARFHEMLYLASNDKNLRSFDNLKKRGLLGNIYTKAFDRFLTWTRLPHPENITDQTVHLFLSVCDLSLNPCVGYPKKILDLNTYFSDFHPGSRFFSICEFLKQSKYGKNTEGQSKRDFIHDHSFSFSAASEICGGMNNDNSYDMPGVFTLNMQFMKQLIDNKDERIRSMSLNMLFLSHLELSEKRSVYGDEYSNPLVLLLESPKEFKKLLPPFMKVGKEIYLTKDSTYGFNSKEGFLAAFFSYQIVSDFLRQYVTSEGEYSQNYDWLPESVSEISIETAKDLVEIYGLSIP